MKNFVGVFCKSSLGLICFSIVGCASLLMLPDEVTESHYRNQAGDISSQVKTKMSQINPGAKVTTGDSDEIGVLPVVYVYDTTNTLGKNEEVYYTSIFNNSTGSWIKPFATIASGAINDELTSRGFKPFIYVNSDLENLGAKDVNSLLSSEVIGTPYRAIAFNGEDSKTNLAITDATQFRKAIVNNMRGVAYMKIKADWEPSSANTLNGDIVLNTALIMGIDIVLCGADSGCTTLTVPFAKGIVTNLFMPNRNTIKEDGLDKNYDLIKSIHGDQLKQIIKLAFEKMDSAGTFKQ